MRLAERKLATMMTLSEVEAWNARYPVGTAVELERQCGGVLASTTAGPLRLWGDWEIVELDAGGCVRLERIRVVESLKPSS